VSTSALVRKWLCTLALAGVVNAVAGPTRADSPSDSADAAVAEIPDASLGAAPAGASNEPATPAEADHPEPDLEMLRHREHITRTHRTLGIVTLASMSVTTLLGTLLAINEPTVFGPGLCINGSANGVLGTFGCDTLVFVHETSAFITLGLYTATGIFALSMPDPEHASVGNDARARRLRLHQALAWVHLVGMVLEPLLGIVSTGPSIVGVRPDAQTDFRAVMNTVHLSVGYITLAALTTAMIIEL
jgi:hypothetical protein